MLKTFFKGMLVGASALGAGLIAKDQLSATAAGTDAKAYGAKAAPWGAAGLVGGLGCLIAFGRGKKKDKGGAAAAT